MPESLVVVGAGGLGRETVEAVRAINARQATWDLLGYLDDGANAPDEVDGLPVLGPTSALDGLGDVRVVVCTGRPGHHWSRKEVVDRLGLPSERYATVVHPGATLPAGTSVGPGSIVLAGTIATTPAVLGAHVTVMPGTILTHDDVVGDFATFGAGVRLAGGVTIGDGAYLGTGALVRENVVIGPWSLVGMGAVVLHDVPAGEVWAGIPARHRGSADVPPEILGSR